MMSTSNNKSKYSGLYKKQSIARLAFAIMLAGFSLASQADKITSITSTTVPGVQDGFGGLNFDNIDVVLDGAPTSTFDPLTGAYSFAPGSDLSYESRVYSDNGKTTEMGKALAKDWPVGEPAGIKIVNDDTDVKEPKPANCIMSTSYLDGHYLDEADPQKVICSSSFQSHKRYKLAMLPTTVAGGAGSEAPIDLVFNLEAETGSRDYQVYQKINNWTNARLKGFTIQVGTGTGGSFIAASGTGGAGVDNLSLYVPDTIWTADQLANFSTGLFGGLSGVDGYFDPDTRAGFTIAEYPNSSGETDTLTSGAILPSDYPSVPPVIGAAVNQFGDWLPNTMLPYGIFYDDDGNPATDAELVAWYGVNSNGIGWITGQAGGFADIPDPMITDNWSNNSLYFMGVIDDLVNVGLNYIVTVGDVSAVSSSFTIRITPVIADNPSVLPSYVGQTPTPALIYTSSDAEVRIDPSPFLPGSLLTARVMDADLNLDPGIIETTTVEVTTDDSSVAPYTLTLEELGEDRGAFAGNLPDDFSNVAVGTTVTVTYIDADDGAGGTDVLTTASSTAVVSLPSGNVQFNPASYTVAENGGNVVMTVERIGGDTDVVTVDYQTESGTAVGNEDYVPDSGTLVFADAETSKTITIAILDDTIAEGDQSFSVLLSNAQGTLGGTTIVGTNPATVTITDDEVSSDSSSGCSCSTSPDGSVDPLLPALLLASLIYLGWRAKETDAE